MLLRLKQMSINLSKLFCLLVSLDLLKFVQILWPKTPKKWTLICNKGFVFGHKSAFNTKIGESAVLDSGNKYYNLFLEKFYRIGAYLRPEFQLSR